MTIPPYVIIIQYGALFGLGGEYVVNFLCNHHRWRHLYSCHLLIVCEYLKNDDTFLKCQCVLYVLHLSRGKSILHLLPFSYNFNNDASLAFHAMLFWGFVFLASFKYQKMLTPHMRIPHRDHLHFIRRTQSQVKYLSSNLFELLATLLSSSNICILCSEYYLKREIPIPKKIQFLRYDLIEVNTSIYV